jgi:superfamily II DNA or RNA helicase/very-short-patch-repair endonuclease
MPISNKSPASEKVSLFRSLFCGRDEVYPRRFVSKKTGRAGYSPVCGNEWIRGICEKPRIKCSECAHQQWRPVTDEVIRCHLSGKDANGQEFVMGVYPMLVDETCRFLAVDFDGENWSDDALAFLSTCEFKKLPAYLERSRSGNGGHVWLFFDSYVPATLARKLGSYILTETMELRPQTTFSSYDRFFPNQDTLPRGGFGNLIALPLQKLPRQEGHSLFVDRSLTPIADQWKCLDMIIRIPIQHISELVQQGERRGRIIGIQMAMPESENNSEPWKTPPSRKNGAHPKGPMPKSLELVFADQIYIPKVSLPPSLHNALARIAAFQNPEFYKAQAMRLPTYDKPRIIACAEDHAEHLGMPRGCMEDILALLTKLKICPVVTDKRVPGEKISFNFEGRLRPDQMKAGSAMQAHENGVLSATTAFGKTVLAAWLISQRGVNTLILVHRQQLMDQWVERLSQFLTIPRKDIGCLGGGRKKLTGKIDVAIIQSLVRKGIVKDLVADYGHLIIDECHHLSAHSFELVARSSKARYVLGLSATVSRKDGHHPIIFMQCGPVRHTVDARQQAELRPFTHEVIVRPTGFRLQSEAEKDPRKAFQQLSDAVYQDHARNQLICSEVIATIRAGRSPIILTERTEHIDLLTHLLSPEIPNIITLKGGMGKKALSAAMDTLKSIPEAESRLIIATGRFVGEGFDDSRLDTLFLTMPISWRGTIAQYVGRLHRLHHGKKLVQVYDYADLDIPMLSRMFDRRCAGYEAVGYTILLPASALPGWPPEVPLPLDPKWKHDYAASIRRLIRDGVDQPLAELFLHATAPPTDDAKGIDRARSASEAFLYKRLQTVPETQNQFQLNATLSIPFNDRSTMEVDFLCERARLIIELDGEQHLDDPTAYRRDRRKDVLLQERGYFILRFLTSDLGKNLDQVLDTILRTLSHQSRESIRSHGKSTRVEY